MAYESTTRAATQVLYDKKWFLLLRRSWVFRNLPFVDFALAAGSMATGAVREESDFDVILGCRGGRIFTARFFAVLIFGALGWRRKKLHLGEERPEETKNKICLNHFVTERSYRLRPPHSPYWKTLYQALVPIYGDRKKIAAFFAANASWCAPAIQYFTVLNVTRVNRDTIGAMDLRYQNRPPSLGRRILERLLGGRLGNAAEQFLKRAQIRRIERGLRANAGYKPRVIYSDEELEFHPDTRRIEELERHQ